MPLEAEDVKTLRRQWRLSRALVVPVSLVVIAIARLHFKYRLDQDIDAIRADIWKKLDAHAGPVIWAANHLTLIDSFLVYWAVFPVTRLIEDRRIPWSTPEYTNYYKLGGPIQSAFVRGLLYLCRCIPFLRGGEFAGARLAGQLACALHIPFRQPKGEDRLRRRARPPRPLRIHDAAQDFGFATLDGC